jgi:GT2 family glycosyltransferase/glycosyltransferase involved in cell wall biosynthesis
MIDKPVSVIIPVYNAFEAAIECIFSVIKHSPDNVRIIAIDDKSSGGDFAEFFNANAKFNDQSSPANLKLLKNEKNLGFVGTCNRGMVLESGSDDVILLNSDTVVTKNWILKLQKAAYSFHLIGTVTPLTNNGTICSVPKFLSDNELPDYLTLDEYAELVERAAKRTYPVLPTCVGFCTYIKREVLNKAGYFDPAFSKGYGEENDLSLRCQKLGYKDVLDDATFIYHKGSLSFGDMKEQLSKDNSALISQRYPNYFSDVSNFCATNPLQNIQGRIENALITAFEKKHARRILHVLHNGPFQEYNHSLGGTEMYVRDLIQGLPEHSHWSLIIKIDKHKNSYVLCAHLPNFTKTIHIALEPEWLKNIIQPEFFECVHIHHTLHYDREELSTLCGNHPHVYYSVHDYYALCPFIYMRTKLQEVCTGIECVTDCGLAKDFITSFRENSAKILKNSKKVLAFSDSTREVLHRIFGAEVPVEVVPHGITSVTSPEQRPVHTYELSPERPVKAAFLSPLIYHKGRSLILECSKIANLPNGKPIEWHLWSEADSSQLPQGSNLKLQGRYSRETLADALSEKEIDLIIIPSLCMETFSYTLTESWNAGLPTIVTPYGALKERVESTGAGWVMPDESPDTLINILNNIFTGEASEYTSKQKLAKNINITNLTSELGFYCSLYGEIKVSEDRKSVLGHIQKDLSTPTLPPASEEKETQISIGLKDKIKNFIVESSRW